MQKRFWDMTLPEICKRYDLTLWKGVTLLAALFMLAQYGVGPFLLTIVVGAQLDMIRDNTEKK
jgi:hypothetical protein